MVVICTHYLVSCSSVAEKVNISYCNSQQMANDYNVHNISVHHNIFNFLSLGPQPLFVPLTPTSCHLPGERGNSHIKNMGLLSASLKRTPLSYQDPVLWVWLELPLPLRGTMSYLTQHFFRSIPKGGPQKLLLWTFCGYTP